MIRFLAILFVTFSFSIGTPTFESAELSNNFTAAEIRDLQKLTSFFKEQMCGNQQDYKACLDSLNPIFLETGWQPILQNVDFEEQQALYRSFESNVFNEIWTFCKSRNPKEGWERRSLCPNTSGKYMKFLNDLGKRNGVLEAYKDGILVAGDFMGIQKIENEIYQKSDRINLNDPAIQVLISIDYLTPNDQQKRKEPWPKD